MMVMGLVVVSVCGMYLTLIRTDLCSRTSLHITPP